MSTPDPNTATASTAQPTARLPMPAIGVEFQLTFDDRAEDQPLAMVTGDGYGNNWEYQGTPLKGTVTKTFKRIKVERCRNLNEMIQKATTETTRPPARPVPQPVQARVQSGRHAQRLPRSFVGDPGVRPPPFPVRQRVRQLGFLLGFSRAPRELGRGRQGRGKVTRAMRIRTFFQKVWKMLMVLRRRHEVPAAIYFISKSISPKTFTMVPKRFRKLWKTDVGGGGSAGSCSAGGGGDGAVSGGG